LKKELPAKAQKKNNNLNPKLLKIAIMPMKNKIKTIRIKKLKQKKKFLLKKKRNN
jgi:hypothetical protein